jgi:hypothetical protein
MDVRKLMIILREAAMAPQDLIHLIQLENDAGSIDPVVHPRPGVVARDNPFRRRITALLNAYAKRYRQRRFRERVRPESAGIRIVSEGDSWFQYPFLLDDVIDQLSAHWPIYSLGKAGDTLETIIREREREIFRALDEWRPQFLLLSGGGNDMVGNGRLTALVGAYHPARTPRDYAHTKAFDDFIAGLVGQYRLLFNEVRARHPGVQILIHGYDAPIPREGDLYLGQPLRAAGLVDPDLQVATMIAIMDRYNAALAGLAAEFEQVHHVNCRGCLAPTQWADAMHPSNDGFACVSGLFHRRLSELADALGLAPAARGSQPGRAAPQGNVGTFGLVQGQPFAQDP